MQGEFTGRKQKITKALHTMAEEGLERIEKVAGRVISAHVIFATEKYRHKVEVAIQTRLHSIVGISEAPEEATALHEALEKAVTQAVRQKKRKMQLHRKSKDSVLSKATAASRKNGVAVSVAATADTEDIVTELHVVPSKESMAKCAMSLHEAVKEAEYRNREVFVFRDHAGDVKVLHRTREGVVHLIEVPQI